MVPQPAQWSMIYARCFQQIPLLPNSVNYLLLFTYCSGKAQIGAKLSPPRVYTFNQYAMLFLEVSFSFRYSWIDRNASSHVSFRLLPSSRFPQCSLQAGKVFFCLLLRASFVGQGPAGRSFGWTGLQRSSWLFSVSSEWRCLHSGDPRDV